MAPFLAVVGFSRSMSIRLGKGPGNSVVQQIGMGDLPINPQTGGLNVLFYANLGDPNVRKDYQHHAAIGAIDSVGVLQTSPTGNTSDLFMTSGGFAVTAGSGLSVNVALGVLHGRTFGGVLDVPAVTNLALQTPNTTLGRIDVIAVDNTGRVFSAAGTPAPAQVFEVDTLTLTGATGGTLSLTGAYNGVPFTVSGLSVTATAAQVATAVLAATGLASGIAGTGGALGTGAVTLTASGIATGTFSNLAVNTSAATGAPVASYVQTTAGVLGPQAPVVSGNSNGIATVVVAANATTPGTIANAAPNVLPTT